MLIIGFNFSDLFNNVLSEIREKVVQEIEIATGVKAEFKKPRMLSGGDSKDVVGVIKHQNPVSDEVINLMTPLQTHGLAHSHILSVDMFSKEQLNDIFNLAQTLRIYVLRGRPLDNILRVSGQALFYQLTFN